MQSVIEMFLDWHVVTIKFSFAILLSHWVLMLLFWNSEKLKENSNKSYKLCNPFEEWLSNGFFFSLVSILPLVNILLSFLYTRDFIFMFLRNDREDYYYYLRQKFVFYRLYRYFKETKQDIKRKNRRQKLYELQKYDLLSKREQNKLEEFETKKKRKEKATLQLEKPRKNPKCDIIIPELENNPDCYQISKFLQKTLCQNTVYGSSCHTEKIILENVISELKRKINFSPYKLEREGLEFGYQFLNELNEGQRKKYKKIQREIQDINFCNYYLKSEELLELLSDFISLSENVDCNLKLAEKALFISLLNQLQMKINDYKEEDYPDNYFRVLTHNY